ncbi:methyltransferase, FkbM family [Caballeronia arationis]|uniref:Methyltransferase, FkbM family n=1 Tax=Caballeronia arationis TaxID=1777142 RepID=A0A7Z7I1V5_9BURK|nr:FkbM family methyltransferase [Caballeronia arationis]SOE48651.1 methyltransferase, FkbM family [Caballeronia arationis]
MNVVQRKLLSLFRNIAIIDRRKLYQVWEQSHLAKLLDYLEVDCVFDIGANRGQYAKMLRCKVGYTGLIFSFEPNPRDAHFAREASAGDERWIVMELAIAETDGEAKFNVMRDSEFSSLSLPSHRDAELFREMNAIVDTVSVRTERLETVLFRLQAEYNFKRPFLKMDTQGFDVKIVRASAQAMRKFVGMQSELSIAKLYTDSVDFREALTEYERCGFSLSAFVPNNAGHFPRLLETDCVMIRSDLAYHETPRAPVIGHVNEKQGAPSG